MEFICRRYSNPDYIMRMDVNTFVKFVQIGVKKEQDEQIHAQWVSMLPLMSTGQLKYISFSDYCKQCRGENIDWRPTDEIIKELEELHGKKLV